MEIKYATGKGAIYNDALSIRLAVFVDEQQVPRELEYDDLDTQAKHWVGYVDNHPVVTIRTLSTDSGIHIQRVATIKSARHQGYARELLNKILQTLGPNYFYLGAQLTAVKFYEKLGFKVMGEPFIEAGIQHKNMELNLK